MANKTFKIGMPYLVHLLGFLPFSVAQYRVEKKSLQYLVHILGEKMSS